MYLIVHPLQLFVYFVRSDFACWSEYAIKSYQNDMFSMLNYYELKQLSKTTNSPGEHIQLKLELNAGLFISHS